MCSLDSRERQVLLEVARHALTSAIERRGASNVLPAEAFSVSFGGVFVSLHSRGRLRGCIGQITPDRPLVEMVGYCAKAAALEDPRFPPVRPHELAAIEIEISVLSRMEKIAPERVDVGTHGLMVIRGWQRGILLPQVAAQRGWTGGRFLEETCTKAGLEPNAWKEPETIICAFTADVFRESDFRSGDAALSIASPAKPNYSSST